MVDRDGFERNFGRFYSLATLGGCAPLASMSHIGYTGLTGFDVSNAVRVCDPSFSDSLNGETTELPMSSSLSPPDFDQTSEESS